MNDIPASVVALGAPRLYEGRLGGIALERVAGLGLISVLVVVSAFAL